MEKYILKLERVKSDSSEAYRTIFKTEHGRDIFLSLIIENSVCTITDCFYVDRNKVMYYKDGKGVVKECCYYDRKYKSTDAHVTPPMLFSCFFPYTREGILNLLNNEICCDFTHILITNGIDIDSDKTPLCGAL